MIVASVLLILLMGNPTKGEDIHQNYIPCPRNCSCSQIDTWFDANCSHAGLSKLPINALQNTFFLDLSNNNLTYLKGEELQTNNWIRLFYLNLTRCNIQKIHVGAFDGMQELALLDLSNNNISTLEVGTFDNMTNLFLLHLNQNRLIVLESGFFKNCQSLYTINLSHNQLTRIEVEAFVNLSSIQNIHLSFNNLTVLKRESFQQLRSNVIFELHHNPWKCDCELREFYNSVNIALVKHFEMTKCKEPKRLANYIWFIQTESDDFACAPRIVQMQINDQDELNYIEVGCKAIGVPSPKVRDYITVYKKNQSQVFFNFNTLVLVFHYVQDFIDEGPSYHIQQSDPERDLEKFHDLVSKNR